MKLEMRQAYNIVAEVEVGEELQQHTRHLQLQRKKTQEST